MLFCVKQMTWRLGILFTMLSARGGEVNHANCREAMILIRNLFPQKDMFKFATPEYHKFVKLVNGITECPMNEFNNKIDKALQVFS